MKNKLFILTLGAMLLASAGHVMAMQQSEKEASLGWIKETFKRIYQISEQIATLANTKSHSLFKSVHNLKNTALQTHITAGWTKPRYRMSCTLLDIMTIEISENMFDILNQYKSSLARDVALDYFIVIEEEATVESQFKHTHYKDQHAFCLAIKKCFSDEEREEFFPNAEALFPATIEEEEASNESTYNERHEKRFSNAYNDILTRNNYKL